MSRQNRRKKVRKGKSRLTPENRVIRLLKDGEWRSIDEIQSEARVQLVVVRRMVSRNNIKNKKERGILMYRLTTEGG